MWLSEIATRLQGELLGADIEILQVASLSSASSTDLCFVAHPKYLSQVVDSGAGALLVGASAREISSRPRIVVGNPHLAFARVAHWLNPQPKAPVGIHPSAVVDSSAAVDPTASIGAWCSIGAGAHIGPNVVLDAGCCIGAQVYIGADCRLHANVVVEHGSRLGERCIVHPNAVIGSDGFGNVWDAENGCWLKIPQLGSVVIGNDVEIGASTTIDRGALGDTIIEDGVRLDNQIQIAHNVFIGAHTAMAGCVGVAGSTRIGAYCTFGGSAMILGHLEIADRVNVMAGTLVGKSILKAGTYVGQYPVQTHQDWLANASHLRRLDALVGRLKTLERKIGRDDVDEGDKTV